MGISKNMKTPEQISKILKYLISQGIKPYYVATMYSDSFLKECNTKYGFKEGDFFWCQCTNLAGLHVEPDSIVIIN